MVAGRDHTLSHHMEARQKKASDCSIARPPKGAVTSTRLCQRGRRARPDPLA